GRHAHANRLVGGKFVNAGQPCIAPDYILVSEARRDALVDAMKSSIAHLYGSDPKASPDLARIINTRNFDRLHKMLDDTVAAGAKVATGGQTDAGERYIAPTILTDVKADTAVIAQEDFGPRLPPPPFPPLSHVPPL